MSFQSGTFRRYCSYFKLPISPYLSDLSKRDIFAYMDIYFIVQLVFKIDVTCVQTNNVRLNDKLKKVKKLEIFISIGPVSSNLLKNNVHAYYLS